MRSESVKRRRRGGKGKFEVEVLEMEGLGGGGELGWFRLGIEKDLGARCLARLGPGG